MFMVRFPYKFGALCLQLVRFPYCRVRFPYCRVRFPYCRVRFPYCRVRFPYCTVRFAYSALPLQCALSYICRINVEWPGKSPMMLSFIARLCCNTQFFERVSCDFFMNFFFPLSLHFFDEPWFLRSHNSVRK